MKLNSSLSVGGSVSSTVCVVSLEGTSVFFDM